METTQVLIGKMKNYEEIFWQNPEKNNDTSQIPEGKLEDASKRLTRFAAYIQEAFPETAEEKGLIESPLTDCNSMKNVFEKKYGIKIPGSLFVKCDSQLPISGSIKARGGIYEVLKFAETLAIENGLLSYEDDYRKLMEEPCRDLFAKYSIMVGSTGNLGLSIGIMSKKMGFQAVVHMSKDAREWKKEKLRSIGAKVVEHEADYSVAVTQGRREAQSDPFAYFIDDENSEDLFLGYSVAAGRLQTQLNQLQVEITAENPLIVHLPCGVGGGPGGVAYGLKKIYGDACKLYFVEPTHAPCMTLGLMTGKHDAITVQDFGLDGKTAADGLAVSRPSRFVGKLMSSALDGCYTVSDPEMFALLALAKDHTGLKLEPSATTGFYGLSMLSDLKGTHIFWATGGSMVPEEEYMQYYKKGKSTLEGC